MYVAGNNKQLKTQLSSYAFSLPHHSYNDLLLPLLLIKVSPTGPKLVMTVYSRVPNNILASFHDYAFNWFYTM